MFFENRNIFHLSNKELSQNRRDMQIIFQDPFSSLNPRQKAGDLIGAPFVVHGIAHGQEKTEKVLDKIKEILTGEKAPVV